MHKRTGLLDFIFGTYSEIEHGEKKKKKKEEFQKI